MGLLSVNSVRKLTWCTLACTSTRTIVGGEGRWKTLQLWHLVQHKEVRSRAESRRALVSTRMEESKPCALQCLPRRFPTADGRGGFWELGRTLWSTKQIWQSHITFVTKTIPHSPHGRPQSISVNLIHSKKLPLYPPPTHKGRESWMVEVMMPTFLPSAWFGCGHDPTQVKRNQTIRGNFSGNAYCFHDDCRHNTCIMPLMLRETVSCVFKWRPRCWNNIFKKSHNTKSSVLLTASALPSRKHWP